MSVPYRWVDVASAFAVAAVGVVGVSGAAGAERGQTPSPCTSVVSVATWSPNGKRIAFVGNGDRSSAICVADADGRHAQPLRRANCPRRGYCRLINTPEDLYWVRPDRLIYSDAAKGLFAVPLTGKPRRFGASTDSYGTLSIDARGDRVAYGSSGGPGQHVPITIVSVPSGKVVGKIGGPTTDNVFPSLSPSGKHVVFVQATATTITDLVAAVDGGDIHPLTQCSGEPLWSPTGDKVACPDTGYSALLLVSLQARTTTTLIPPVGPSDGVQNGRIFAWSPNGQRIALLYGRCGCRLDVVDLGTGKLRQLLGGAAGITDVTWSPNSRQLLATEPDRFSRNCDLLWRLQADGGKRRVLRGCS